MTLAQDQLRKAKLKARNESLSRPFENAWRGLNGPKLEKEFSFAEERKWRFDYAHPVSMIAIELQGGIWIRGGHSRGLGQIRDYEKHNTATLIGWTIFYLCCEQITVREIQPIIDHINNRLSRVVHSNVMSEAVPNHFHTGDRL